MIAIVSISGGVANIDITGDGVADSPSALAAVGITAGEQAQLATTYPTPTSLWRVSIPHFSAWDFNWPFAPPPGSGPPDAPIASGPPTPPNACQDPATASPNNGAGPNASFDSSSSNASSIECQNGILHEAIALAGTPYSLVYSSDRVAGYGAGNHLIIPLSGATLPADVVGISLEVDVAGRTFTQDFPATTNQTTTFDWDGDDAFGRAVQGVQTATVSVGFVYQGVYLTPGENPNSPAYDAVFGHFSYYGTPATGDRTRQTVTLWARSQAPIGHWSAEALGLGGWTFDVQHVYEPATEMLRLGDGRRQPGDAFGKIVTTFAGNGNFGFSGDGGPAANATLANPWNVAVTPDGSVLVADRQNYRIRKIDTTGTITTVAGNGNIGYVGDGVQATQTGLNNPEAVVAGPDGSFYIADVADQRVLKVDPTGVITTVAGNGSSGYSGDGGLAIDAQLANPNGLFLAPDGSLYIADSVNCTIRKVDAAGLLSTVAGTGVYGYSGDGGVATKAQLSNAHSMVLTPDGALIISDRENNRIRRVDTAGIITTIAGNGTPGFSGDGGPAVNALISQPQNMALGKDGTLYFADHDNVRIRAIRSDGVIYTVAGAGTVGFAGDNGPALDATFSPGQFIWGLALSGDGQFMYIGDGSNNRVRRLSLSQPGFANAAFSVAARDGSEVYSFDAFGRHLATTALPTNATNVIFGYDANGLIQTLTDAYGNVTTVTRDASGRATSVVGPYGVTTSLAIGSDGYLASVTGPAGAEWQMAYENGSLTAIEFPTGSQTAESSKTYDALGRVVVSTDAAGHSLTFSRAPDTATEVQVSKTTTLGVSTGYDIDLPATGASTWTTTLSDGTTSQTQIGADGSRTLTSPDGTRTTYTPGPDLRFGMQVPLTAAQTIVTPSGLTKTSSSTRVVTLSDPNNPLSLVSETDIATVNGNAWTTVYDALTSTFTTTSPMGRTTTRTVNAAGDPLSSSIPGVAPWMLAYDAHGRPQATTQGTFLQGGQQIPRTWTQAYDTNGYLSASTDPLGVVVTYNNDLAGRPTDTFLPVGPNNAVRDLQTTFDGDDDLTSLSPPNGGEVHQLLYTPVDGLATYSPPSVGAGTWSTQYAYDGDGRLQLVTRPDQTTIQYGYDPAGRLSTTTYPQGVLTRTYNPTTGLLAALTAPSGVALGFTYDGFLPTGTTWTGPVAGSVTMGYDPFFRMNTQSVNGSAISFGYDLDNLLTGAGEITITRDPQNGRVTGTKLGAVTDAYTYDSNGLLADYSAFYNGVLLYEETIGLRDGNGRILQKAETVQSTTHVWGYTYDASGRLTDVSEDGTAVSHYGYDADGNRTSFTTAGGTIYPTYDAQDRLLTYGSATYAYTANGELLTKADASGTTAYTYDALGNLLAVNLPGGEVISYVVDGMQRRLGRVVNGALIEGFLYQNALNVVAHLDPSGNVIVRYVFGSKGNTPDYFTSAGGTFRILSDHLGSPRAIVNTASGAVAEEIDYDELGNVVVDTAPGLTAFGFAGGLSDRDTGLTRFGTRDYDPRTGTWTRKDPTLFQGGTNLYAYAGGDPVNEIDPAGTDVRAWRECLAGITPGDPFGEIACVFALLSPTPLSGPAPVGPLEPPSPPAPSTCPAPPPVAPQFCQDPCDLGQGKWNCRVCCDQLSQAPATCKAECCSDGYR